MKENKSNIGKFVLVAAIAGLTGYAIHIIRTAKSAKHLKYQLTKIQLYNFASGGNLQIRVWVSFTNLESAPLTVKQLYLDIFLNFDGSLHRIGTLNTNNIPITIPGNSTVDRSFDVNVPWANIGVATLKILSGFLTTGRANWPSEAKVQGQIKAIGFTIPVDINVPFTAQN
jgi:hypothetical protein